MIYPIVTLSVRPVVVQNGKSFAVDNCEPTAPPSNCPTHSSSGATASSRNVLLAKLSDHPCQALMPIRLVDLDGARTLYSDRLDVYL